MARVTGIGGVFLKAKDPKALAAWYAEHLGVKLSDHGGIGFPWSDEVPKTTGMTVWSAFPEDTTYFGPGKGETPQATMINYRVDDLDGLLEQLKAAGVWIDENRGEYSFGRFAWVIDPEGNRLELWQPIADEGEQSGNS